MDDEEKALRLAIMNCLAISGEYDWDWTNGYIDVQSDTIMAIVDDLVQLIQQLVNAAYQRGKEEGQNNGQR